ncbi:MAG: nucleotidyltransferase domain-containing protein [Gemmatimonadota bacterium]
MADYRQRAERFIERVSGDLGSRLRSVVLHGSVARGEAVEDVSDVNLLVLVDDVEPGLLRTLGPHARRWLDREHALPLLLEWGEWQASSDAFAIETADMLDAREVLHGDDPLEGATVQPGDLRLQAEHELRSKLIHVREGLLAGAGRPTELGRLVLVALPSLATYFRAALRLAGDAVPAGTPAVLEAGSALVDASPGPLTDLWASRSAGRPLKVDIDAPRVRSLHDTFESLVHHVDTLGGGSG